MSSEYGLLVSFPDQSETFVLGFEAGQLWEVLKAGSGDMAYSLTMHTANEEVFTRIARHYGCTAEFKRLEGGWSEATLRRSSKPKLQLIRASQETRESPADLVGALQDKVHTDAGPFRAGHGAETSVPHCCHEWRLISGKMTTAGYHYVDRCAKCGEQRERHAPLGAGDPSRGEASYSGTTKGDTP